MVRYVVEDATEDMVILKLQQRSGLSVSVATHRFLYIHLRCGVCDANTGDVHVKIVVVEGTILSKSEANREEKATEREERRQNPAFVVAGNN